MVNTHIIYAVEIVHHVYKQKNLKIFLKFFQNYHYNRVRIPMCRRHSGPDSYRHLEGWSSKPLPTPPGKCKAGRIARCSFSACWSNYKVVSRNSQFSHKGPQLIFIRNREIGSKISKMFKNRFIKDFYCKNIDLKCFWNFFKEIFLEDIDTKKQNPYNQTFYTHSCLKASTPPFIRYCVRVLPKIIALGAEPLAENVRLKFAKYGP